MKAVLCVQRALIPPTLNQESPNPHIPFEDLRLRVVSKLEEWPSTNGEPRRAGVNSFGFGGTNAHVILGEVVRVRRPDSSERTTGQARKRTPPPIWPIPRSRFRSGRELRGFPIRGRTPRLGYLA